MDLLDGMDPAENLREQAAAKWKDRTQEELYKKAVEADVHIANLEREAQERHQMYTELYEKSKTQASLETLIDQIKREKETPVAQPPANTVNEPTLDLTKIESMFEQKLSAYEQQKREVENFGKVQQKLKERFGNNYATVLQDQYAQLGLPKERMNEIAKESPEAYFRMMGLNQQPEPYQGAPRSSMRNDSFAPKVQKRDWMYYQEMKKTNPKLYLDPKISQQMERDAQELGEAFGLPPPDAKY
jgi:hypothetical protein